MPTLVSESMPEAFVSTERDKGIRHRVRLHDARAKKPTRKHELAVCLQPIFLLADWTILIQFFEERPSFMYMFIQWHPKLMHY
uniref:Glycosyltransferase family 92 protein n=1 Tax=Parascaris univalens TaxID=6257 RepID=A0A915AQZ7_PARUN